MGDHSSTIGLPLTFLYRRSNEAGAALASAGSYAITRPGRPPKTVANVSAVLWEDRSGRFVNVSAVARRLFTRDAPILVTVAVGRDYLGGVTAPLADALVKRAEATSEPAVVVTCENFSGAADALRASIEHELFSRRHEPTSVTGAVRRATFFLSSVVDRICYPPTVDPPDRVRVRAGTYSEWIIRSPATEAAARLQPILGPLRSVAQFVSPTELEVYERRKLWCVNGVHLAIGVLGGKHGYWNVGQTLADEDMRVRLEEVQRAMAAAVRSFANRKAVKGPFGPVALARFSAEVLARLEATPNDDLGRLFEDVTRVDRATRQGRRLGELTSRLVEHTAPLGGETDAGRGVRVNAHAQSLKEATRGLLRVVDTHGTLTKVNERIVEPMMTLRPGADRSILEKLLVDVLVEMARMSGRARDAIQL